MTNRHLDLNALVSTMASLLNIPAAQVTTSQDRGRQSLYTYVTSS